MMKYLVKRGDVYFVIVRHGVAEWSTKSVEAFHTVHFPDAVKLAEKEEASVIKRFEDGFEKPILNFEHP